MHIGSILPVGTVIHSMLSTTQFATEYGDNWVLADGRSVTGSKYASVTGSSTIPDMRGRFLRGKSHASGNNPDGDLAIGTYTADKYASHSHAVSSGTVAGSDTYIQRINLSQTASTTNTSASGGNETAPKSITVNIFIRIN